MEVTNSTRINKIQHLFWTIHCVDGGVLECPTEALDFFLTRGREDVHTEALTMAIDALEFECNPPFTHQTAKSAWNVLPLNADGG